MRVFRFKASGGSDNLPASYSSGSCLQSCKSSKIFEYQWDLAYVKPIYDAANKRYLTVDETMDFTIACVKEFILDFSLEVKFTHPEVYAKEGNVFYFETTTYRETYDLYACVIISRWVLSDTETYTDLMNTIYFIKNERNCSIFEAYIIASVRYGEGSYSFTNSAFIDVEEFKALKIKKSLLSKTYGSLNNITRTLNGIEGRLLRPKSYDKSITSIFEDYTDMLGKANESNTYFVKVMPRDRNLPNVLARVRYLEQVPLYGASYAKAVGTWLSHGSTESGAILNIMAYGNWGMYKTGYAKNDDMFQIVTIDQIFTLERATLLSSIENSKFTISPYISGMKKMFKKKGLDLIDECNKRNFIETKLKKR